MLFNNMAYLPVKSGKQPNIERLRRLFCFDNNEGEMRMKPVLLERKDYMNHGFHQGASNGAYMYTLVESCKMSGGSPVAYIKDLLCSLI